MRLPPRRNRDSQSRRDRSVVGAAHASREDRDLVFGIPEVAIYDIAGDIMENKQLEPSYLVVPDPALEAAIRYGRVVGFEDAAVTAAALLGLQRRPIFNDRLAKA